MINKLVKVSVVVPIHNAGNKLRICLDTLINQTLTDIEIICILDLPTDGTDKIAEEYAQKDNRIILIYNSVNLNVAESRNKGIDIAKGEYIGFSDHDDTRDLSMYKKLYSQAIKNNSDIVFSDSIVRENNIDKIYCYNDSSKEGVIKSIILPMNHKENKNYLSKSVWASIYKKELIDNGNIRFKSREVFFSEDTLFNLEAFLFAIKISYLKEPLYCWIKYNESLSNSWGSNFLSKMINMNELILNDLLKYSELGLFKKEWIYSIENLLKEYYPYFLKLNKHDKLKFANILKRGKFPVLSRFEYLKFISKKRIKLYWYVFSLYLYRKMNEK